MKDIGGKMTKDKKKNQQQEGPSTKKSDKSDGAGSQNAQKKPLK
jgi:hypothetical protein